jgi:hypothetical protein
MKPSVKRRWLVLHAAFFPLASSGCDGKTEGEPLTAEPPRETGGALRNPRARPRAVEERVPEVLLRPAPEP